ncbi:MAG: glycosyltransferase family 4 protein [Phycisphaerales bacterium]
MSVVYNGVDTGWFSPGLARVDDGVVRLVTVARLVPVKGLEHAIDAIGKLPHGVRSKVRYEIVGDGELRALLQERIARAGLTETVTLRGALPPDGVRDALRGADVFVFPSVNEGLGIAAIEAMACGLPVVGSRVGGIPEVVAEGQTGLLVPGCDSVAFADAIAQLVENAGERKAMGAAGRARACEVFDGSRQLERVVGIARQAAAARAG